MSGYIFIVIDQLHKKETDFVTKMALKAITTHELTSKTRSKQAATTVAVNALTNECVVAYTNGALAKFTVKGIEGKSVADWTIEKNEKCVVYSNDSSSTSSSASVELDLEQENAVDCVYVTTNYCVRAAGSGYDRAYVDVIDVRNGTVLKKLRLPTGWPAESASFEVHAVELNAGNSEGSGREQLCVCATSCRATRRSYDAHVCGCESAIAVWMPFTSENPIAFLNVGPTVDLVNSKERVVEAFLAPKIVVVCSEVNEEERTKRFEVHFERITELNGEIRCQSGKTEISYDPVKNETIVLKPIHFDQSTVKIWGSTSSKIRKLRQHISPNVSTYDREFGKVIGVRGDGVLLVYFPSGEAIVRAFADPAFKKSKRKSKQNKNEDDDDDDEEEVVSKETLRLLEHSLRTSIVGSMRSFIKSREVQTFIFPESDDDHTKDNRIISCFILSRDVDESESITKPKSLAVLQEIRVPLLITDKKKKSLLAALDDFVISENKAREGNGENSSCALCLLNEHELVEDKLLANAMPCCASTICNQCLYRFVRQYPQGGCPNCRNVPLFHAFAGSSNKLLTKQTSLETSSLVQQIDIEIESFNVREGLAHAISQASLETTGSELEDLELFEANRGKREKIALIVRGRTRTIVTLGGATGLAYVSKIV